MKWVKAEDTRVPIKSWCDPIEAEALQQAKNLANLPFTFKHVALMPDCHTGYGMPIGGVLATNGVVVPNAVGVDIGCGMAFVQTNVPADALLGDKETLTSFVEHIKEEVPVGFNHHTKPVEWTGFYGAPDTQPVNQELDAATYQLGTLGGGNHFIELQESDSGFLCLMVHSGSRNFGYKIAKYYNKLAQKLCKMWYSNIPEFKGEGGLAFLPIESSEAKEYMASMNFALSFAQESRARMLAIAFKSLEGALHGYFHNLEATKEVNIHHNFAAWEHHSGKNVIVHRKGATKATKGLEGIIPGSMGTPSYIVRGLGNKDSFESCSHGAGRKMSRSAASKRLTIQDVRNAMGEITFEIGKDRKGRPDLSEAPQAYKDIDEVIEAERDLVEVLIKLKPLAVVKG